MMAASLASFASLGLVNIVGGCCGTTPEHIAAIASMCAKYAPRTRRLDPFQDSLVLSGMERLVVDSSTNFVNIGERCNVSGSRKFARLVTSGDYEEALNVARAQVESGAQIIDINMDEGLLDGEVAMTKFLNLISTEPDVAKVESFMYIVHVLIYVFI